MGLAPSGLNIGDIFEEGGHTYRVTGFNGMVGYDVEIVTDEPKQEEQVDEPEQIALSDLPFSDVADEEKPRKRGRTAKK